jgi:hypothetical protein
VTTRGGTTTRPVLGAAPTLLVRIQHHPARADLLTDLLPQLHPLTVEVVEDPEPDERPSAWRTYRECLLRPCAHDRLLVLQDDVIVADGFTGHVGALVASYDMVALFLAGAPERSARRAREAHRRGDTYASMDARDWVPTVALAWAPVLAQRMVEWTDGRGIPRFYEGDDNLVGAFVRHHGITVWATVPSVVQHPDVVRSLVGRRNRHGRNPLRTAAIWQDG